MFKNILLMIVSFIVSLAIAEGALRIIMPERQMTALRLINNRLTYEPGQLARSKYIEWDYEVRINADGFRNSRTLSELSPRAILMLGDSFAEGFGVAAEQSFPSKLEDLLQDAGQAKQVYNAGHSGTNPVYYRLIYDELFSKTDAIRTVVVAFYVGNDFIASNEPDDGHLVPGNEFGQSISYRVKTFFAENSMIYATANYALKTNPELFALCRKAGPCAAAWQPADLYSPDIMEKFVPATARYLGDFARRVEGDGRKMYVVVIPPREQVDDRMWAQVLEQLGPDTDGSRFAASRLFIEALRREGVRVTDLGEPIRRYYLSGGVPLYFVHDAHLNPEGHAFVAREIFRQLQSEEGGGDATKN